jgi:hypothetical protein
MKINKAIINSMSDAQKFIELLVKSIEDYFELESHIKINDVEVTTEGIQESEFLDVTAFLTIEDKNNMVTLLSCDKSLLEKVLELYSENIDILDEDGQLLLNEMASDILNVVVGRALGMIGDTKNRYMITPPEVNNYREILSKYEGYQHIYNNKCGTKYGKIMITCIVPK